jgi:ABC-type multidrug transport system ATPase subunit
VKDAETEISKIISLISKNGCQIQRVETTKSSLEDVFLSLTGRGINE